MTEKHKDKPAQGLGGRRRNNIIVLGLIAALLAGILISFALGRYPIPVGQIVPILIGRAVDGLNALINAAAGLFGAAPGEVIPFEQTWDPSDPNVTQDMINAETARILAKFQNQ